MSDRPKPPGSGPCGKVMVADCWYDYLNADRDWALAELQRYREAPEKLGRWLIHEDDCAAINGRASFVDACTCGLGAAIAALLAEPKDTQ